MCIHYQCCSPQNFKKVDGLIYISQSVTYACIAVTHFLTVLIDRDGAKQRTHKQNVSVCTNFVRWQSKSAEIWVAQYNPAHV